MDVGKDGTLATRASDRAAAERSGRRRPAREEVRTRRYDPADTRQRVLEAAYLLFGTRGYDATGTADIARAANVSEGSIFYHFGSKPALLAELGRLHGEKLVAAMQGDDALADVTFATSIERCFAFHEENCAWEGMVEEKVQCRPAGAKALHHRPEAEPFFLAARQVVVEWTRRHLEALMARRPDGPRIDAEVAASFIFAVVGDALQAYFRPGATDEERRRIRAEVIRFCTAAVGAGA